MLKLTPLETDGLRRCQNCSWKLLRATLREDLRKHIGHLLYRPTEVSVWEAVKIKLGWL